MINKITMANVASYKQAAILETDRKINLIYGLNGSGKSTFSNFLYNRETNDFSACSIEPPLDDNTKFLVYNQSFINDNFYQSEAQPGIFSLSKENKDAQKRIDDCTKELEELKEKSQKQEQSRTQCDEKIAQIRSKAEDLIWAMKLEYTGGDRVLDFCLDGFKTSKTKLFDHILLVPKPAQKPETTIDQLKQEAILLRNIAEPLNISVPSFNFPEANYENDPIFKKIIVGDNNSSVADLIKQLNNQNWVKEGLQYLTVRDKSVGRCPFCQSQTITDEFVQKIKDFFSGEYEHDIKYLEDIWRRYKDAIHRECNVVTIFFDTISFLHDLEGEFQDAKKHFFDVVNENLNLMRDKCKSPNIEIELASSVEALSKVNAILAIARQRIADFNQKIAQRQKALEKLKNTFWQIQRWEYDQTISSYNTSRHVFEEETKKIKDAIKELNERNDELKKTIAVEQAKTVSIKEAIDNINANLLAIGIDSFHIETYRDNLYKITREGQLGLVFPTLSEGEKMMISFLYFLELCRGKQSKSDVVSKKIIVIDDPISSLSHIYIFNICKLIKDFFLDQVSKYKQIFILTHSLYFFYEIFKMRPKLKYNTTEEERREKDPKLHRLCKNANGSYFLTMAQNEIQNDYQAYWAIIKDRNYNGAIIANAMRNILEYFFGFIDKCDLNGIFQKPKFSNNKYQAFVRFMNARSHSTGELIYDYNEFDYDIFIEALHAVFTESQYEEHYKKMMGEHK